MAQTSNQQSSGLSPRAPDFTPVGDLTGPGTPGVPAPVDSIGRSGVALMQGGQMCAMLILPVVTNWHFSRSFRLIFLNIYQKLSFRLDLISLTTLVQTHFACLLSSQINRKRVYWTREEADQRSNLQRTTRFRTRQERQDYLIVRKNDRTRDPL